MCFRKESGEMSVRDEFIGCEIILERDMSEKSMTAIWMRNTLTEKYTTIRSDPQRVLYRSYVPAKSW